MALTAKGRNQNYKITKVIIIVVLIVIIIIIIMITIIIISYHYLFLNQLKQMTFCCCRSFLSVCLLIFFFIKARGSEANPTCKMSTTCSGSVNNWSAMWQKSSSNTLSSWLDPSSLFFPWKKKTTNTYDNLAVHLFRHFRRKTFTFTQFVAEGKLWISNGLFIEINTFFCIFSITFTALLNAFSVCNVRTWEKR